MLNYENYYVYELKESNINDKNKCLVKSKMKLEYMKKLIFYIQYKYHSIIPESTLTETEIKEILISCYDVYDVIEVSSYEEINLQENFKRYFSNEKGKGILDNFFLYEVNGLIGELRKIVYRTIEMWR